MMCKTIEEVGHELATKISASMDKVITINVMSDILSQGSVLRELYNADPRLIPCVEGIKSNVEHYGAWSGLQVHITYTGRSVSLITKVDSLSDFHNAAYHAACLHNRELVIVYPEDMYEEIREAERRLVELPRFLNCFVSAVESDIITTAGCSYKSQILRFHYSCTYREWMKRKIEISEKTEEIIGNVRSHGIEDWKKAYEVVRYCVTHWKYGRFTSLPGAEYTNYGAIVQNTAVCMGISLAICTIFRELGIPCKYIRGMRNGEGHAWNMIYLRGGWFYIDVTDAICRKDPLFHWGMTTLNDRIVCAEITENLRCHCPAEYIKNKITE